VPRGRRVGVVQVVPRFPEAEQGEGPEVGRPVADGERRSPIMWHIELTDQVTWCSSETRTSPAQKNAVSAPAQDMVISPPITAGPTTETIVQTPEVLVRPEDVLVRQQVRRETLLVGHVPIEDPAHVCVPEPLASAATEVPKSHGECGSPSRSENAW